MFSMTESLRSRFYLMAKPPAALARAISGWSRARDYDAARLHMTLARLGAADALPPWLAGRIDGIAVPPFRVVFDRIAEGRRIVALAGSETMRGAMRAQRTLLRQLSARGVPTFGPAPFRPHVTIRYRPDGRGSEAIDPVSWRVERILLIESVIGEGRHVEHGRWPLRH